MVHGRLYARPEEDKAEWFTADWWMSGEIQGVRFRAYWCTKLVVHGCAPFEGSVTYGCSRSLLGANYVDVSLFFDRGLYILWFFVSAFTIFSFELTLFELTVP